LSNHQDALKRVIDEVVAPAAAATDSEARFPRDAVRALGEAGILGLTSSGDVGGAGAGLREAADVIECLAGTCGSTAMVVLMHYAATAGIEAAGPKDVRASIATGQHLTTLAFSETGSRSQFWAPVSTAERQGDSVVLNAKKSWVTSAAEADSYVWSSRPLDPAAGPMTLWLVPRTAPGISFPGGFDGVGLRGNGSVPVTGANVTVPADAQLGADGSGLDVGLTSILPTFLVLSGAFSLGLLESVTTKTGEHLGQARLEHLGETLVQQQVPRLEYARLRLITDSVRAMLADTLAALEAGRPDAQLRVLQIKAFAAEQAAAGTDLAMKVCGGAAFRRDVGIERHFRDSLAARVMAPTTDALHDIVGRALSGLPLLGPVA
jgi:alkylation response protein AidB-like acyl-CoA dehydrogenase